jgi:hypothetical protein
MSEEQAIDARRQLSILKEIISGTTEYLSLLEITAKPPNAPPVLKEICHAQNDLMRRACDAVRELDGILKSK